MTHQEIKDRLVGAILATNYENGGFTRNTIDEVQEKAGGYSIHLEGCAACLHFSPETTETLARGTTISDSGCLFHLEEGRKTKIIDWEERTWQATLAVLASKDMATDLETAVNTARAIVMIYRLMPEKEGEK